MAQEDFLSQDEVDALLKGVAGEGEGEKHGQAEEAGGIRKYDLGRADRIVRGRMQTLELINEGFTRHLRIGLFNYMHRAMEVSAGPIRIQKYSDFIHNLAVPANFNLVQFNPLRGTGLIVFDPNLVFLVVDNLFGGDGRFHSRVEGRDFTPTEQRIIQGMLNVVFAGFEKAWKPIYELKPEYVRAETNPQFVNIATPGEIAVTITYSLEFSGSSAEMHLCLPYSMIEPIHDILCNPMQNDHPLPDRRWTSTLTRQLQTAEVELRAYLGSADITLGQILRMKTGDIIPIEIAETITAEVGEIPVLECRYGTQHGQYALKVERFIPPDASDKK